MCTQTQSGFLCIPKRWTLNCLFTDIRSYINNVNFMHFSRRPQHHPCNSTSWPCCWHIHKTHKVSLPSKFRQLTTIWIRRWHYEVTEVSQGQIRELRNNDSSHGVSRDGQDANAQNSGTTWFHRTGWGNICNLGLFLSQQNWSFSIEISISMFVFFVLDNEISYLCEYSEYRSYNTFTEAASITFPMTLHCCQALCCSKQKCTLVLLTHACSQVRVSEEPTQTSRTHTLMSQGQGKEGQGERSPIGKISPKQSSSRKRSGSAFTFTI